MLGDLEVTSRRDGDLGVLSLAGEMRLELASRLYEAGAQLLADGARSLIVSLAGVSFMDSASLAALIRLDLRVVEAGGRLVLSSPSGPVRRVLTMAGLEGRFPVAEDEPAARALLA